MGLKKNANADALHNSNVSRLRSEILGENRESVSNDCICRLGEKLTRFMESEKNSPTFGNPHSRGQVTRILSPICELDDLCRQRYLTMQQGNPASPQLVVNAWLSKVQQIRDMVNSVIREIERECSSMRPSSVFASVLPSHRVYQILQEYTSNRARINRQQVSESEGRSNAVLR